MTDAAVPLTTEALASFVAGLGQVGADVLDDAARVDLLGVLETLKSAAAGAQARVTADFTDSQQALAEQAWAHRNDGGAAAWFAAKEAARAGSLDGQLDSVPGYVAPEGRQERSAKSRKPSSKIGVYAQVGLARRDSPSRGSKYTRMALVLRSTMPNVQAYLEQGVLSEWRALIITGAVSVLSPELQQVVDAQLGAAGAVVVGKWGDRQVDKQVRAMVAGLDAEAVVKRMSLAEGDRRVSVRAAPDGMAYLTGTLSAKDAITVQHELANAASAAIANGDERSRGQLMADTLVARVTGIEPHEGAAVEIQLIMTEGTLVGSPDDGGDAAGTGPTNDDNPAGPTSDGQGDDDRGDDAAADVDARGDESGVGLSSQTTGIIAAALAAWSQPADLVGYGPIPGAYAQHLVAGATKVTVRRVYVDRHTAEPVGIEAGRRVLPQRVRVGAPESGADDQAVQRIGEWLAGLPPPRLAELTSPSRLFEGMLRRLTMLRDAYICRTPWCSAPARHVDHVHAKAAGGPTAYCNSQGLCVRCNLVKELVGWSARVVKPSHAVASGIAATPRGHVVATTTPTGHIYVSTTSPVLPGLVPTPNSATEAEESARAARSSHEIYDAGICLTVVKLSPLERLLEQQFARAA